MNYQQHIVLSLLVNGSLLFVLSRFFVIEILTLSMILTWYLFSILPDIDHTGSHVSAMLRLFLLYIAASSVYDFVKTLGLFNIVKVVLSLGVFIVHVGYAETGYKHRRFPHTFTFGVLSCLILLLLVNSIVVALVGLISFFLHILSDGLYERVDLRPDLNHPT